MENRFGELAMNLIHWLEAGLFPVKCLVCGVEGGRFCVACQGKIFIDLAESCCPFCHAEDGEGKTCEVCAQKTYLDGCTSLGFYHDRVLRSLLQSWKFQSDFVAGENLKNWLKNFPFLQILPPVDWWVTSIPLHPKRQRERGFNQAEEIAVVIAEEIESQNFKFLKRVEWTDPQAKRKAEERAVGDLDESFVATGLMPPCVLLCDDVFTSGATMDAAAKALKAAGAQIVWGLTLARAGD